MLLVACALLTSPAPVVAVGEAEAPSEDEALVHSPQADPQVPEELQLDERELDWGGGWDAVPSINLGLGLVWHPSTERKVGFNGNILFGATVFQVPFTLWPEVGLNVGTARDRVQLTGVAQLGLGIAAILYYHVGFEGGLTVDGVAYGPRHGPSLRALQFFGLEFRHKVFFAHMQPGVVRHDLTLNFSVDFGAFIGVATGDWGLW